MFDLLAGIAKDKKVTPAQIALTWLMDQKPWIAAIPGTTKLHRLHKNLRVADADFSPKEINVIDTAFAAIPVQGDRCPTHLQQSVRKQE